MRSLHLIASLPRLAVASALPALAVLVGAFAMGGFAIAQQQDPTTTSAWVPLEGWVDVLNTENTHVIDSVYLSGGLHFVVQVWGSGPSDVQRLKINANLEEVSGTSPTTGQRYRAVGASSVDLQNPLLSPVGDLFLEFPKQTFTFRLQTVDPEPASLNGSISYTTYAASYTNPVPTEVPFVCKAVYTDDGRLVTDWMKCPEFLECLDLDVTSCPYIYVHVPDCCVAVYDESGKVIAWNCPGITYGNVYYYGDDLHGNGRILLAACSKPTISSQPRLSLFFGIPFFTSQ